MAKIPRPFGRFVRSRQQRAAFWYAADGKCQICGSALGPGWHLDHIVPWAISGETRLEGLQAVCRACNLGKGALMLRRHQQELSDLLEAIVLGLEHNRRILVLAACGGGKSALPVIAARWCIPGLGDRICIVTPRAALQEQMEGNFLEGWLRKLVGHTRKVQQATNQEDPSGEFDGYVTTYQALAEDEPRPPLNKPVNLAEFEKHRYILVLDECHHIVEGSLFHRATQPLVDRAALVILMTGTVDRADGKRIAYLEYRRQIGGGWTIDEEATGHLIKYTRRDALGEHAVIPTVFEHLDGMVSYIDGDGQVVMPLPLSGAGKHTREAIFTALRTEYAKQLLARGATDWLGFRRAHPWAKLLIVAPSIPLANDYLAWAKELGIASIDEATSKDDAAARQVILRFRGKLKPTLDAIVTVGMAYEGLDQPDITHTICLTHIRSRSWIEQLLSRGNRVSKHLPWEAQRSYAYTPDDALMMDVIDRIRADEGPYVRELEGEGGTGGATGDREFVAPLDGWKTRERIEELDGGDGLSYEVTARVREVLDRRGIVGVINPLEAWQIFKDLSEEDPPPPPSSDAGRQADDPEALPPSIEKKKLMDLIETYCRAWDVENEVPFGTLNGIVYAHFGKSRTNMGPDQLRTVIAWIKATYPQRRTA